MDLRILSHGQGQTFSIRRRQHHASVFEDLSAECLVVGTRCDGDNRSVGNDTEWGESDCVTVAIGRHCAGDVGDLQWSTKLGTSRHTLLWDEFGHFGNVDHRRESAAGRFRFIGLDTSESVLGFLGDANVNLNEHDHDVEHVTDSRASPFTLSHRNK